MTLSRYRAVAIAFVGFNVVGTVLTWIAHLQKPGTSLRNAIGSGTEITGPVVLIAVGAWRPRARTAPTGRFDRAGQSIRSAMATMIPSGPRTYAMRHMSSYWPMPPTRP